MSRDARWFFEAFAISTRLFPGMPLTEAIRRIAAKGFRWVELWSDGGHLDPRHQLDVAAVSRLMRELRVGAHSVHTPFVGLELGHPHDCDRGTSRSLIAAAIERAAELGARVAVVHPNSYEGALDEALHAASRAEAQELVAFAVEAADSVGVRVAVENMVGVDHWRFGTSLVDLVEAFPDPRVGFCLDVGHATVQGLDLAAEAEVAGDRLVHVHAHDNDGRRDQHLPPLRGIIRWAELDRTLERVGYRGRRVLEIGHQEGFDDALLDEGSTLWERWPAES